MQRTEVCVVGAGPAGLVLALILVRAGIPCVVLEKLSRDEFRRRAGAGLIEYRTVQLLEAHGLADPILVHGGRNRVCEFRLEGQSFAFDYATLTGGCGHYIYPQHELVATYLERLQAAGGEVRFGMRVSGVEEHATKTTVLAVAEGAGDTVGIECQFVAGCDGARSALLGAIPDAALIELHHPVRWLALLADTAPSKPRTLTGFTAVALPGRCGAGPS